jgi:hypothetical protein
MLLNRSEAAMAEVRKVHEEMLSCGYKKCCPTISIFDDGSAELTDDDPATGSVGTIKLRPEVAGRLAELLKTHTRAGQ